jgi:hypothetical protein
VNYVSLRCVDPPAASTILWISPKWSGRPTPSHHLLPITYAGGLDEDGERAAALDDDPAAFDGPAGGDDPPALEVDTDGRRGSAERRHPAREVADGLGDVGAILMEAFGMAREGGRYAAHALPSGRGTAMSESFWVVAWIWLISPASLVVTKLLVTIW